MKPYIYSPIYETVAFPMNPPGTEAPSWAPEFAGFTADVLSNPSTRQVRDVAAAHQAMVEIATPAAEAEFLRLIAPWVKAWNLRVVDAAGDEVDATAPGEVPDNWEALYLLPLGLLWWLTRLIPAMHQPRVKAIWLGQTTSEPAAPDVDEEQAA